MILSHAILAQRSADPSADRKKAHDALQHSVEEWNKLASSSGPYNAARERAYAEARLLETEVALRRP